MKAFLLALAAAFLSCAAPAAAGPDWSAVDAAFGRPGAEQAGGVHRYGFPRSDLKVVLDGVRLKPALALGSWVAMEPTEHGTLAMGDLVLLEREVNPVMSALLKSGITVTALHNHLLGSSPVTMYMHIHGHGDPVALAKAIRAALALSATPLAAPGPAPAAAPLALDTAALDRLMGGSGKPNGGVYQFSFPRPERILDGGMPVPPSVGLAIAINFQPTGSGRAVTTGDFVLRAEEVTRVMKALRTGGIDVTALHNHLGDEQPRLFFMHFWGNGEAAGLARTLRSALNEIGKDAVSSREVEQLFAADQAARDNPAAIDWKVVAPQDEARRVRAKALLASGTLTTADDFYHASVIFQHGNDAKDYLVAHTLAVAAAARGREDAALMAAMSLDRYLQAAGQPQIYGTQYKTPDRRNTTQEPYDRTLVSDALRQALGVPIQAEHEVRRREIEARYRSPG